jgi:glutathione peroxidase
MMQRKAVAPVRASRAAFTPVRVNRNLAVKVQAASFHDFEVKNIDGVTTKMSQFKGKVCLVVNLASQCGFTPQYTDLEKIQQQFPKDLAVIGFPCNQFGGQEPGSNKEIKQFAKDRYNVTFPLMSKVDVNGPSAAPLFEFMKNQKGGIMGNDIKWNFSKFLIDKEGNVVGRYPSSTAPGGIEGDIKKYL